ncbi:MAG: hypothetical protein Q9M28_01165 [Mariprofundaceae bacterium]|nr:hypothetical protein [Mariprofundaceae bacterium]
MRRKLKNKRAEAKIANITAVSLIDSDLPKRLKFNFSYLSSTPKDAYAFDQLSEKQLIDFLVKISAFCKTSFVHWEKKPIGGGGKKSKSRGKVIANYGDYPERSRKHFPEPTYIPENVHWKRFRLEGDFRLIGFMIPPSLHNTPHKSEFHFDKNTFYAVFIDPTHKFSPTSK